VRAMRLPVGYADAQFALRRNIDLARSHARI
jgi:hypothetical protein